MPQHLQKKCCEIVIVKPERLASTDETEGTCNQSGGSTMHSNHKNLIWLNGINQGEELTNKTSQRCASLQGGSLASGESLRQMVMWPCAFQIGWTLESPVSSRKHRETGKGHSCIHIQKQSGGAPLHRGIVFVVDHCDASLQQHSFQNR
eukprot:565072-Rhodomonas_salina.1